VEEFPLTHSSDFDNIAALTGDESWSADNMRKYFAKLEDNHYLLPGQKGHGYEGWLGTDYAPIDIVLTDPKLLSVITGATFALGNQTNAVVNLASLVAGDANSASAKRDSQPSIFQIPLSTADGKRGGSREFVVAVRDAKTASGAKAFPLGEFLSQDFSR
jgi:choline dehydrogenase